MKRLWRYTISLMCVMLFGQLALAQSDLAAVLEVLEEGVEVQRVGTEQRLSIGVETIVGVGDTIFTSETGRARITFFADGVSTELEPQTEYVIKRFDGEGDTFNLSVEVVVGQTAQQIQRTLDANSTYNVETPGMALAVRGTEFALRIEPNSRRSGMLVFEGTVAAASDGSESAMVPPGFGILSFPNQALSDVVRATTFEELYSAIDGCRIRVTTPDDVSINVRTAPTTNAERIDLMAAEDITRVFGTTASGNWYRLQLDDDNFGWFLSSTAQVLGDCAGLRQFEDDFSEVVEAE